MGWGTDVTLIFGFSGKVEFLPYPEVFHILHNFNVGKPRQFDLGFEKNLYLRGFSTINYPHFQHGEMWKSSGILFLSKTKVRKSGDKSEIFCGVKNPSFLDGNRHL